MTFKSRLTIAIATGAVLVNALAPLASADTVTVSGNGAFSNNAVNVTNSSNTVVNQTNNAEVNNHVDSSASTGGNSSNFNTGGTSTIYTGNAATNVTVNTAVNLNKADVSGCSACNGGATNVTVKGNGAYSDNGVVANNTNGVFLNQNNNAEINNDVNAKAYTGKNDSSYNTGGSSVVVTGNATNNVTVDNTANANIASIGGNGGSADPSSVTISGNGALSGNGVVLNQNSAVVLEQTNSAEIGNDINAKAKTGYNQEQFNTGGNNGIRTGNATNNVTVNNDANFNAADLSCDCTLDGLTVKVAGNGGESWNAVNAAANNAVFPTQTNGADLWNDVFGGAKTGANTLGYSTGSVYGDPVVITGDGSSTTTVNNAGNANVYDNGTSFSFPSVGVSFDLTGLLAYLHIA